jgi:hypothetical protein
LPEDWDLDSQWMACCVALGVMSGVEGSVGWPIGALCEYWGYLEDRLAVGSPGSSLVLFCTLEMAPPDFGDKSSFKSYGLG